MSWEVVFADAFECEFDALPVAVQDSLLARLGLLRAFGPHLRRPYADTLQGSQYPNMKEIRFDADGGVWRVAYAFDPLRKAIVLVAGDKTGISQGKFYQSLIDRADARFQEHLSKLAEHPSGKDTR